MDEPSLRTGYPGRFRSIGDDSQVILYTLHDVPDHDVALSPVWEHIKANGLLLADEITADGMCVRWFMTPAYRRDGVAGNGKLAQMHSTAAQERRSTGTGPPPF